MAATQDLDSGENLSPRNSELNALEQRGYSIGKKIGQGSYASVHLADYVDQSSKKLRLACKIFDKEKAPHDFLEKFFPRELDILTKIENPHIIQVHSILQRGPRVFIFMNYAENGDLLDHIKRNGVTAEHNAKMWFRQMSSGLQYLHNKNIAHRDLKCENILLSRKFHVKIADFGFARFCVDDAGRRVLSETYCGSAAYAAPEVVSGTPYNPKLADVWSLGIILFIMLNASMPFDDSNLKKLLKDQTSRNWMFRTRVRETASPLCKSIVRHILEPDITLRLTLDRILAHEWLRCRRPTPMLFSRMIHSAPSSVVENEANCAAEPRHIAEDRERQEPHKSPELTSKKSKQNIFGSKHTNHSKDGDENEKYYRAQLDIRDK